MSKRSLFSLPLRFARGLQNNPEFRRALRKMAFEPEQRAEAFGEFAKWSAQKLIASELSEGADDAKGFAGLLMKGNTSPVPND